MHAVPSGSMFLCVHSLTILLLLFNPFRADHRAQLRQTVHPERESQQDPAPQHGDSDTEGQEGTPGNPQTKA